MVIVGHSQGGLLTKILVQESGLSVWDAVVNVPYPASLLAPSIAGPFGASVNSSARNRTYAESYSSRRRMAAVQSLPDRLAG